MKIEKSKLYYCISGGNVIKSAIDWNDESGDFTDKIAVVCNFKEDFHYVQQLFGDVNHNRPLVFINEPYGCKHDGCGYKVITIEELKQFYKMEEEQKEPKYFAISKEEWNEYQELKNKKNKIDFDRLKPGSLIKVVYNGEQISADIDSSRFCTVVSVNSGFVFDRNGGYSSCEYSQTINVIQDGKLASFASNKKLSCIKEVISY